MRQLAAKYGIYPRRSLGQHFLFDGNIIRRIVREAEVGPENVVLEIGPGLGSMTQALAAKAKKVIAVELDRRLIPALQEALCNFDNVKVIQGDALKLDLESLVRAHGTRPGLAVGLEAGGRQEEARSQGEPEPKAEAGSKDYKVVANLPYYITTPLVIRLLERCPGAELLVLMVQEEVAERLVAAPGTPDYGALSVAVQFYSQPELLFRVRPTVFWPRPEVGSAVVRLSIKPRLELEVSERELFFRVVQAAFGRRRKTLANALEGLRLEARGHAALTKEQVLEFLARAEVDAERRGETLSLDEFARLAQVISRESQKQLNDRG